MVYRVVPKDSPDEIRKIGTDKYRKKRNAELSALSTVFHDKVDATGACDELNTTDSWVKAVEGVSGAWEGLDDWTAPSLKAAAIQAMNGLWLSKDKNLQALHFAITGKKPSTLKVSEVFDICTALGREETLRRLSSYLGGL